MATLGTERPAATTAASWPARRSRRAPQWERTFQRTVIASDAVTGLLAGLLGLLVLMSEPTRDADYVPYRLTALLVPVGWVLALAAFGAYESRCLGSGSEEYKRVGNTGIRVTALFTFAFFLLDPVISRRYVVAVLAGCVVLTLVARYALRKVLHARRAQGDACYRVLALGDHRETAEMVQAVLRDPAAGLQVVARCDPGAAGRAGAHRPVPTLTGRGREIPTLRAGSLQEVLAAVAEVGADMVALSASPGLSPQDVRALGWELETLDVGLVVAPALTNVAGPRIHIRPVSGLPLLHVEDPNLHGAAQAVKSVSERVVAALLMLFLAPLLLGIALAIRWDSKGPALFTQQRMGRDGEPFTIHKFRTMKVGADAEFVDMIQASDTPEGLFWKMREDPRITRVGAFLRRYSLDELPQLIDVLQGTMSLVGPRPLPLEVEQDASHVRRRLLVRPGMTGLWQISGRSDLPWEEALRFDMYYVENWSIAFDLMIMWKTVFVVAKSRGAY